MATAETLKNVMGWETGETSEEKGATRSVVAPCVTSPVIGNGKVSKSGHHIPWCGLMAVEMTVDSKNGKEEAAKTIALEGPIVA